MPVIHVNLEEIAKWPTPNYINPVRRTWMPAFVAVWQVLVTIVVVGRFYLRSRKLAGTFGLDDVLVFFGYLLAIGVTITVWISVTHYGLDRHTWDVKYEWASPLALYGLLGQTFFVVSTSCTKLSILLFYRRMIKESLDRRWVWALRSAFAFTLCYAVAVTLTYCLSCRPLEALWKSYSPTYTTKYKCVDTGETALLAGIFSVITDLIAVALPCAMLNHYNLAISARQKIFLNLTFGLGLVATGAGVARTYYLWKLTKTSDYLWTGHTFYAWSIAECQLAIICASAPSLRAFFRHYLRDTLKRSFDSGVSHYADGTHDTSHGDSSTTRTEDRKGRVYTELKPLESGVHGVQYPPPVILNESTYRQRQLQQSNNTTDEPVSPIDDNRFKSCPPSPRVTSADEFECYVNTRLSQQSPVVRERLSRSESIIVKMNTDERYTNLETSNRGYLEEQQRLSDDYQKILRQQQYHRQETLT